MVTICEFLNGAVEMLTWLGLVSAGRSANVFRRRDCLAIHGPRVGKAGAQFLTCRTATIAGLLGVTLFEIFFFFGVYIYMLYICCIYYVYISLILPSSPKSVGKSSGDMI